MKDLLDKYRPLAILIIIGLIVLGGWGITTIQNHQDAKLKNAQIKLDKDESALISSALDVYYTNHNVYPNSIKELNNAEVAKSANELKEFNYKVRGDYKAYQFTYVDHNNQKQTVTGSYSEQYH